MSPPCHRGKAASEDAGSSGKLLQLVSSEFLPCGDVTGVDVELFYPHFSFSAQRNSFEKSVLGLLILLVPPLRDN